MNDGVKGILAKRRDRTIAILLNFKESECDKYLPREIQVALRKQILDQVNDFYDLAIDLLRSLDTGTIVLNQEYLDKVDKMHEMLEKMVDG